jgi:hypothetical protein
VPADLGPAPTPAGLMYLALEKLGCRKHSVMYRMEKPSGRLLRTRVVAEMPDRDSCLLVLALAEALRLSIAPPPREWVAIFDFPLGAGEWPEGEYEPLGLN